MFTNDPWDVTLDFFICWWYVPTGNKVYFGLGRYNVIAKIGGDVEDQFLLDYRTSTLPEDYNSPSPGGGSGDVVVDFDVSAKTFYEKNTQIPFPSSTSIWELKSWIDDDKDELEPLPPDNFQLSSSGGYPYLTWVHSSNPDDWWTAYGIYRSVVSGGGGPENFSKIATIAKTVTSYTDYDLAVHGPMTAYYKIVAANGGRESEFTETLDISVGFYKTGIDNKIFSYKLFQNYPNPFNPSTSIEFSIKDDSFVSLKVYDLPGREIATVVNEFLNSGTYRINFDGSNLESGIYFYEIGAGDFRDMKKFILIK